MLKQNSYNPEFNNSERIVQSAGYIPMAEKIENMLQAGQRLAEHRAASHPGVGPETGETVDKSIFNKRYYDKIDIAELAKKSKDAISNVKSRASAAIDEKRKQSKGTTDTTLAEKTATDALKSPPVKAPTAPVPPVN